MQRPLGAQISHMLKARGVDVIFGIPGVHNQEMYRGIEEAGIEHVLARHEQGAGFMADGYARATGRPGVAYVITGPGVCNIMTPMGQAYSDSVPVLVLSSCLDEVAATKGQLHQMKDQRAAAETVCDWSEEAETAKAAYQLIDRAFSEFQTMRARPKHIQVPISQLEAAAEPAPDWLANTGLRKALADETVADDIAKVLSEARRPMMICGGGAKSSAAHCANIAARAGVATFCTYAGRGVLPGDHPYYLGSMLARPGSAELLAQADLLLVVGSELSQVDLWREDLGHDCPMIRIDLDPSQLSVSQHQGDMAICGDAAPLMAAINALMDKQTPQSEWDTDVLRTRRKAWRAEVDAERPGIAAVCEALQAVMPDDAMVFSDMTQFAYAAKEIWDMPRPGHWHHPYGFGTLGYATPAAIGAAIARRGQPTLAIIGDYGFHYTMQELGVAVELGLSLPILLWDNGKLGEIEDSMIRAQIAPNAVIAKNPDFCALAQAFGAHAEKPDSLTALQEAVTAAFATQGPTLIYLTPELTA